MKKIISFFILLLFAHSSFSQADSVMYSKDFIFKDGIYITFQDFRNNDPPLTPENFKKYNPDVDYLEGNFFKGELFHHRSLNYADSSGNVISCLTDSIYGFCIKNEIFIYQRINESDIFYKIFRLGKVYLLFELKGGKGPSIIPILFIGAGMGVGLGVSPPTSPSAKKADQYLMSFDTGNIYKYKRDEFSILLEKKNKELFNEFSKLSKAKQKDMMFIYLNKLNERKPIYFKAEN